MTLHEVVTLVGRLERVELETWVERGWVQPSQVEPEPAFSELDIARVCLICDLRRDLAVEDETIPLVLSLLDQLYATRRRMNALMDAVRQQPEQVRGAILACAARRERT
jgi:chaperone modulatory protein CbpM